MTWTLTGDLDDYVAAAAGFLRSRPVQHTIQLAATETLRGPGHRAGERGRLPAYRGTEHPVARVAGPPRAG